MGCDFYIYVYLEIDHCYGKAYIELPVRRGYFGDCGCGYYDSDDDENHFKEEYDKLYNEMIQLDLRPHPPIVIYENGYFVSHHFEDKYRPLIEKQFQINLLKNQKYDNDPNYKSDADEDEDEDNDRFYKRYEDEGISPDNFDLVFKITRKEDRKCPSIFFETDGDESS